MAPPQPRKGPTRIPQNPLMGGYSPYGPPNSGSPMDFTKGQGLPGQPTAAWPGGYSPYGPPNSGSPMYFTKGQGLPGQPTAAWPGGYSPYGPPNSGSPMRQGSFSPVIPRSTNPDVDMSQYGPVTQPSMQAGMLMPFSPAGGVMSAVGRANTAINNPLVLGIQRNMEIGQQSGPGASWRVGPQAPASPLTPAAQAQMDFMQRQEEARQQNRYGSPADPNRLTPDQKLQIAEQASLNREGSMQPGGAQMQQRFAPESPLGMRADTFQRGQMGVDRKEGVFIQEGGRGSNQTYLEFNKTREGALAAAQEKARARREDPTAQGYRSPEERAALIQQGLDRRQSAIEAGLPKQRAEEKRMKLQDRSLKRAVTRGLNPLSPQAQALYPEAAGRLRAARMGGGQPNVQANAANPLRTGPGGTVTAQDKENASTLASSIAYGVPGPPDKAGNPTQGPPPNPFVASMGADPENDPTIGKVHSGMIANLHSPTQVRPTPDDLRQLRNYADALSTLQGDDAFTGDGLVVPGLWKALVDIPADASDESFSKWYSRFIREAPVAGNESVGRWELPIGM
jgi:hypothetical protein